MNGPDMSESPDEVREPLSIEFVVQVQDELGLHARPAARLARIAQSFVSEVSLSLAGEEDVADRADAKSILDILSLCAPKGASLVLRCTGPDAGQAAEALTHLFANALFYGDE